MQPFGIIVVNRMLGLNVITHLCMYKIHCSKCDSLQAAHSQPPVCILSIFRIEHVPWAHCIKGMKGKHELAKSKYNGNIIKITVQEVVS